MDDERVHITVSGRVQGVGFRWFVRRTATSLFLTGWVKNLPSGAVELVVEGSRERLGALGRAVVNGPPSARVNDVEMDWLPATGEFEAFLITY